MSKKLIFTLYMDESGTKDLYDIGEYDANPMRETHCTLMGCIYPKPIVHETLIPEIKTLKKDIWDTTDIILHSKKIRHMQGPFKLFYYQPDLYERFKAQMNTVTNNTKPSLICVSLNKKAWVKKFPKKYHFKDDPYEEAFYWFLERYAHFLNNQPSLNVSGEIIAEKRNDELDSRLQQVLDWVKDHGTQYYKADTFKRIKRRIDFKSKKFNIIPLQMADYFCYPFYKDHKRSESDNGHFIFLSDYIYNGSFKQYGYKKYPI